MSADEDDKHLIIKLYLTQLANNGIIPDSIYSKLSDLGRQIISRTDHKLKPEFRKKITVVLAGGVFDTLHAGHIFFLQKAKSFGDVLVVSVAKDKHIIKKGRAPSHSQTYRKYLVESIKYVDYAILGRDDPKEILKLVNPDVIVYGYDQTPFLKPKGVKIIQLTDKLNPHIFKTSKLLSHMNFEQI